MAPLAVGLFWFIALMVGVAVRGEAARKKRIQEAYNFNPQQALGRAQFVDDKRVLKKAGLFNKNGIRIGESPDGRRPLFYNGAGHLLLVAAARTGKALTILVGAILSLPRRYSLICVDPKAELTSITGNWRKRFGTVYVLNPFGILLGHLKGLKQARFNPMSILDPTSPSFHAVCDKLAEAICWDEGATGAENHWILSARILISGVIAALAKYGAPEDRNLVAVRTVITGANGRTVYQFCRECMVLADPYIRQKLARFAVPLAEANKELNGIVSTADTQTAFAGNEAIAESLKGSDFFFRDLKRKAGITVFVCLPLDKLDVCSKYFRLVMASALSDLLNEELHGKGIPVVAIFDEMSQIGYLKALADGWAMAAGAAGLQMIGVYQNVSQIRNQFSKTWETIVQNSGVSLWFGARDQSTRDYVSKLAGTTEVLTRSRSVTVDIRTGEPVVNDSTAQTPRPLLHPDEVGNLANDEMLMFCEGVPGVIRAKRKPYIRCSEFRGRYRKNPYFKPSGFLTSLRAWFSW